MIHFREAVLETLVQETPEFQRWTARAGDETRRVVALRRFVGRFRVGERVAVNSTAVDLKLGSGGWDFIVARIDGLPLDAGEADAASGHLMKLNYTPLQSRFQTAEEQGGDFHETLKSSTRLDGFPVLVGELHSMLAPLCAALHAGSRRPLNVVYIMMDAAGLPLELSDSVRELKEKGLLWKIVTCGQAFGGDVECVNVYGALLTAANGLKADLAAVTCGIGSVGTGTPFGFSGLQTGLALDAAKRLGGEPIAIPRMSGADPRERHLGLSHHTRTVLMHGCEPGVWLPLPENETECWTQHDKNQTLAGELGTRHRTVWKDGGGALHAMRRYGLDVRSMGRGAEDDPLFFLAIGAAAKFALDLLEGRS